MQKKATPVSEGRGRSVEGRSQAYCFRVGRCKRRAGVKGKKVAAGVLGPFVWEEHRANECPHRRGERTVWQVKSVKVGVEENIAGKRNGPNIQGKGGGEKKASCDAQKNRGDVLGVHLPAQVLMPQKGE